MYSCTYILFHVLFPIFTDSAVPLITKFCLLKNVALDFPYIPSALGKNCQLVCCIVKCEWFYAALFTTKILEQAGRIGVPAASLSKFHSLLLFDALYKSCNFVVPWGLKIWETCPALCKWTSRVVVIITLCY